VSNNIIPILSKRYLLFPIMMIIFTVKAKSILNRRLWQLIYQTLIITYILGVKCVYRKITKGRYNDEIE